jgi:hypothetical protein
MMVVAYCKASGPKYMDQLKSHYEQLGTRGTIRRIFILSDFRQALLQDGISQCNIALTFRVPSEWVYLYIPARYGFTPGTSDRFATVVCSPKGILGCGERIAKDYLGKIAATSVRAYARTAGMQFTVKEYLIRQCSNTNILLEVNVFRGDWDQLEERCPHYQAAAQAAIHDINAMDQRTRTDSRPRVNELTIKSR